MLSPGSKLSSTSIVVDDDDDDDDDEFTYELTTTMHNQFMPAPTPKGLSEISQNVSVNFQHKLLEMVND